MKSHLTYTKIFLLGLTFAATLPILAQETTPVDGIAAMVNERPITYGEIRIQLDSVGRRLRHQYSGVQLMDRLDEAFEQVLESMIERALILEEFATKERPIPEPAVDEQLQSFIAQNFGGSRTAFLQALADEGLSIQEWRDQIRDSIAIDMMRFEYVRPLITSISPRQLRAAYEERREEFLKEAAAHVWIITLRNTDEAQADLNAELARTIVEQVRSGAEFSDLARSHSTDALAPQGGDRGWMNPDRYLRAELANAVQSLSPGEVSDPIYTPEAWLIAKISGRREAGMVPFDEVRDELMAELTQAEDRRAYRAWINRLRTRHHVQMFALGGGNNF